MTCVFFDNPNGGAQVAAFETPEAATEFAAGLMVDEVQRLQNKAEFQHFAALFEENDYEGINRAYQELFTRKELPMLLILPVNTDHLSHVDVKLEVTESVPTTH